MRKTVYVVAISSLTMMLVASKCSSDSDSETSAMGGQSESAGAADQPASEDTSVYNTEPDDMTGEMPMPEGEPATGSDMTAPTEGSEYDMAPPMGDEGEMPVDDEGGMGY